MDGFSVFLRKELREAWRTSRLPVVMGVFFMLGLISPLTAKYTPELLKSLGNGVQIVLPTPRAADAIDQFLKNVGGDGIFVAILVTMGLVAREKDRGTTAFVLTKPLTRQAFLAAKLIGLLTTLAAGLAVASVTAYAYTAWLFQPTSAAGFLGAAMLVLLMLTAYAAITFLGSTLLRSSLPAAAIGIAAFLVISILGALPQIGDYTPGALMGAARAIALGAEPQHLGPALAGTLLLAGASLALSWLAFRQQEQVTPQ